MKAKVRVGDLVKLTKPTMPITRVGYNLVWYEVTEDMVVAEWPLAKELLMQCGRSHRAKDAMLTGMQRAYVEKHGFGGRERSIHRSTDPEDGLPVGTYRVNTKRTCKTGVRCIDQLESGDYRYLCPEKTHILLTIERVVGRDTIFYGVGEVTLDDCEVVSE